uniref:CCHC-type domain-containing protein n=1 Tax=Trichogramma kaykai TaxID=54128 RepID=A0ABD2XS88_9HYME
MIAEQRQLRVSQEAAQSSLAKLQKDQAEATQKLLKISGTLEVLLLESRQHQADKEDEGIEASKNKRNEKTPKVNAASVPPIEKIVCYRCTKVGHYASSCPLVPQNLWFCYGCDEVKRHNSKNCPNQCQEYVSNNSNSNNKNNTKSKLMRGADRGRGRSSFRGKRFTPYSKRPKAQRAGESNKIHDNDTDNLIFIADSGATEHIVKERDILENFVEKNLGEIKSANKNKSANIKIDGMGNLTFYSENKKEIILWNILAAEGIADNLLSLRKFADAGFGIFLDNKELRIFNKKTGEIHIRGVYREPNWIVTIDLSDSSEPNTKRYDFSARLVDTEYIQASEDSQSSELGREDFGKAESDISLKRKITDLNTEIPDEEIENLSISNKTESGDCLEEFLKHTRNLRGPYREVIGSLLYLAGVTRPDIAYAVNLLSRRQVAPTVGDFQEVKRILRYLRGTTNEGLVYRANESDTEVFTDSSFGDCESSKATSGYIIRIFGDTVAWRNTVTSGEDGEGINEFDTRLAMTICKCSWLRKLDYYSRCDESLVEHGVCPRDNTDSDLDEENNEIDELSSDEDSSYSNSDEEN